MSQKRPVSIILGPADPESCREPLKGKRRGLGGPWEAPGRPLGGPGAAGGLGHAQNARKRSKTRKIEKMGPLNTLGAQGPESRRSQGGQRARGTLLGALKTA